MYSAFPPHKNACIEVMLTIIVTIMSTSRLWDEYGILFEDKIIKYRNKGL